MERELNEIERIHYYLLQEWLKVLMSDEETDSDIEWYAGGMKLVETLIPEYEIKMNPIQKVIAEIMVRLGL